MSWPQAGAWPAAAVRDTVAQIARDPAYQRSLGTALWERFWSWLRRMLDRMLEPFEGSDVGRYVTIGLVVLLLALLVARVVFVWLAEREREAADAGAGPRRRPDPRAEADRLAAAGLFTEAAHALLAALLAALAARGEVRLHDSKTTGDYARELERGGSPARVAFRSFRRRYDRAIYGRGECSAEDFAALMRDAEPTLVVPRAA